MVPIVLNELNLNVLYCRDFTLSGECTMKNDNPLSILTKI